MMGIKQHKIMNICLAQLSIFYFTDDDFRPFLTHGYNNIINGLTGMRTALMYSRV
jgi:hypothetical protein